MVWLSTTSVSSKKADDNSVISLITGKRDVPPITNIIVENRNQGGSLQPPPSSNDNNKGREQPPETSAPVLLGDESSVPPVRYECDFDKNCTELFKCLHSKKWDKVIDRTTNFPREAETWVSRKEKCGTKTRWRLLPIHSAIIFVAPENVIEALLCAYPKGAQCKDDQGMLPIHLAFRNGCSEEVINLLLVAYPKAIDVKDRKGRIPLELAQASSAPHKEAFVRALERGPTYYAVAAAATERAAVTAEQRAIFDTKMIEVKNDHKHQISVVQKNSEQQRIELENKINELTSELEKTKETSQVLVDHVNSLEAQLSSRSDTERFLATKIAALDTSLKTANQTSEANESELKLELERVLKENEELKEQLGVDTETQEKLNEANEAIVMLQEELDKKEKKYEHYVKNYELDVATERANAAVLEAQLKNKIETEHALATQVSALAARLATASEETGESNSAFSRRINQLDKERTALRATVKELTIKLAGVASALEEMSDEQQRIVTVAAAHEETMAQAAETHNQILADAERQEEIFRIAREERDKITEMLRHQEEVVEKSKEERVMLKELVKSQDAHMVIARKERDDLVTSVSKQRQDMQTLLDLELKYIPKHNIENADDTDFIDNVVNGAMADIEARKEQEDKVAEAAAAAVAASKAEAQKLEMDAANVIAAAAFEAKRLQAAIEGDEVDDDDTKYDELMDSEKKALSKSTSKIPEDEPITTKYDLPVNSMVSEKEEDNLYTNVVKTNASVSTTASKSKEDMEAIYNYIYNANDSRSLDTASLLKGREDEL